MITENERSPRAAVRTGIAASLALVLLMAFAGWDHPAVHRFTIAASLLAIVTGGGAGWIYVKSRRASRSSRLIGLLVGFAVMALVAAPGATIVAISEGRSSGLWMGYMMTVLMGPAFALVRHDANWS